MGALAEAQVKAQIQALKRIILGKDAEIARLQAKLIGATVGIETARSTIALMAAESASRLAEQKMRIVAAVKGLFYSMDTLRAIIAAINAACEVNDGN